MQWNWYAMKTVYGFYAVRTRRNADGPGPRTIRMARAIMKTPKGMEVDHRNHNTLDDQRQNLRNCIHQENHRNNKLQQGRTSKHKGVCWHRRGKCWEAQVIYELKKFTWAFLLQKKKPRGLMMKLQKNYSVNSLI